MNLADAVARAEKAGMELPEVAETFVLPPADSSRSWQDHPDGGERLGMSAARAGEGTSDKVSRRYILKAASLAPIGLMALSLLVLHATIKYDVVSFQIETFNASRTYALLSGASLLRALACVSLLRDGYDACEALCRMFWYMFKGMDEVEPASNKQPITKGRAVLIVFSVTLRFAEEIFAGNDDAMSVVVTIRNMLGVTALCGFAARNCSYHSGEVAIRVRNFNVPRRRDRFDGVVRDEQDLSITQALQVLEYFWKAMNKASSKDAVVSILGASFNMCQNGAIPMLLISQCGWCPRTGCSSRLPGVRVSAGRTCRCSSPSPRRRRSPRRTCPGCRPGRRPRPALAGSSAIRRPGR